MVQLYTNASVDGQLTEGGLKITINDQVQHTFNKKSKVFNQLKDTPIDALIARLNGGSYFVNENRLVDFRDNQYRGFVHSEDAISQLVDLLGVNDVKRKRTNAVDNVFKRYRANGLDARHEMGREWGKFPFEVRGGDIKEGGDIEMRVRYSWSPFSNSVGTLLEVERLICLNGMTAMSNLFNMRVPLINQWEDNLNIAYSQIKDVARELFNQRLDDMKDTRASVELMGMIEDFANRRNGEYGAVDQNERQRLRYIAKMASPVENLKGSYNMDILKNRSLGAHAESHMTQLDAWNMLTELDSHTSETADASSHQIQKIISRLVFDGGFTPIAMKPVKISQDSDFNRAFFSAAA